MSENDIIEAPVRIGNAPGGIGPLYYGSDQVAEFGVPAREFPDDVSSAEAGVMAEGDWPVDLHIVTR